MPAALKPHLQSLKRELEEQIWNAAGVPNIQSTGFPWIKVNVACRAVGANASRRVQGQKADVALCAAAGTVDHHQ
jgi:hypothetical protein